MESLTSARNSIAEAKGSLLILMQEGTEDFEATHEWADYMSAAWEKLKAAEDLLIEAEARA